MSSFNFLIYLKQKRGNCSQFFTQTHEILNVKELQGTLNTYGVSIKRVVF
jgi:hypothetical protein